MNRAIHRLVFLLAGIVASSVVAQSKDVVLRLTYDVAGEKRALLRLPESVKDREAFADAVAGVLGIERSGISDGVDEAAKSSDKGLHGVGRVPNRESSTLVDQLNLSAFHAPLVAVGFSSMRLVVRLPESPQSSLGQREGSGLLGTVTYSELIEADQLGAPRRVKYGWQPSDSGALLLRLLILGGLGIVALRQLKRLAIATTERELWRRPYAIVKSQTWGLAAVLIVWCACVVFMASPLPFVYAWPVLVSWSLALSLTLIVVPGMALSTWVHRELYSVARLAPNADWSRRELAIYGLVTGAGIQVAFGVPLLLLSHEFAQLPRFGLGEFLPFLALFIFVPGGALLMNSRFMGGECRIEEHGPVAQRFSELGQIVGLRKVPTLGISWYTRGYLVNALDLTRLLTPNAVLSSSSRPLDARLLTECESRELDTILARMLFRHRRHHRDRLEAIKIFHLVVGGAALLGALFVTVEYDLWGFSSSTRIEPLLYLSFALGVLCYAIYWLHYAWASRRYILREDQAVLSMLDAPTEQVRGVVREAVLAFVPLERAWWWWLSTTVSARERAQRLGCAEAEDWDAILQEVLHQTETRAVLSANVPAAGLSHAMTTQVTLAMMVTFPMLAFVPAIIALAFRMMPTDVVPFWCMALFGGVICAALMVLQDNLISTLGYRSLRRHVKAHQSANAPDTPTFPVIHRPGKGNECLHPSAGFIEIGESALTFQDNAVVLKVPWQAVESLSFETLGFYGVPQIEVCVKWRDVVEEDSRASSFLSFSGTTRLSLNRDALSLLVRAGQKCKSGVFRNKNAAIQRPNEKPRSVVYRLAVHAGSIALLLAAVLACSFFTCLGSAVLEKAIYGKIGALPYEASGIIFCSLALNATFYQLYLWRMNALARRALAEGTDRLEY